MISKPPLHVPVSNYIHKQNSEQYKRLEGVSKKIKIGSKGGGASLRMDDGEE